MEKVLCQFNTGGKNNQLQRVHDWMTLGLTKHPYYGTIAAAHHKNPTKAELEKAEVLLLAFMLEN